MVTYERIWKRGRFFTKSFTYFVLQNIGKSWNRRSAWNFSSITKSMKRCFFLYFATIHTVHELHFNILFVNKLNCFLISFISWRHSCSSFLMISVWRSFEYSFYQKNPFLIFSMITRVRKLLKKLFTFAYFMLIKQSICGTCAPNQGYTLTKKNFSTHRPTVIKWILMFLLLMSQRQ